MGLTMSQRQAVTNDRDAGRSAAAESVHRRRAACIGSSSNFSTRFFSLPWSDTNAIRYLVRSRSRRIGTGGTKLGRSI
jgi:hypothetical protein